MTADARTLSAYAKNATRYADSAGSENADAALARFLNAVPESGHVLDLGCGPAHMAAQMRDSGLSVEAWDGSAEMVLLAQERYDIAAKRANFSDLNVQDTFDGIWASHSLLHASKSEFPAILVACHRALKPKGIFYLSMKLGTGEQRDALDRMYAYYSREELDRHLQTAGFTPYFHREGISTAGLAGNHEPFIQISSHA
ncbi:MAG: class I SAM-dependent DNA methyltransferase [Paracoccaceae bacterium]